MPLENRLKEHRARLGINQADMGKRAGVSRQTISLIERGDYSPSVTLALKLAKICQVTVEDIFSYTEEENDEKKKKEKCICKICGNHVYQRCAGRNSGGCYGNGTCAWSSDRYSGGNAILPEQCPHLDASADGNLWSDSAGTL